LPIDLFKRSFGLTIDAHSQLSIPPPPLSLSCLESAAKLVGWLLYRTSYSFLLTTVPKIVVEI
jgi:hypothetical protein